MISARAASAIVGLMSCVVLAVSGCSDSAYTSPTSPPTLDPAPPTSYPTGGDILPSGEPIQPVVPAPGRQLIPESSSRGLLEPPGAPLPIPSPIPPRPEPAPIKPAPSDPRLPESYRKLGSLPASPQVSGVMARVSDKTPRTCTNQTPTPRPPTSRTPTSRT